MGNILFFIMVVLYLDAYYCQLPHTLLIVTYLRLNLPHQLQRSKKAWCLKPVANAAVAELSPLFIQAGRRQSLLEMCNPDSLICCFSLKLKK